MRGVAAKHAGRCDRSVKGGKVSRHRGNRGGDRSATARNAGVRRYGVCRREK